MPAMEEKGAAQSAGRGAEGKAGSNEEWGGSKGPSGEGGIASLTPEGMARYQSALSPAAQVMQGTRLGTYAGLLGQGIGALGAPMTQPPQQGGQLARNVVGSGMNPATAAPSAVSGQKGAAPSAFPAYFAGQTATPAIGEALQKYGVVNPNIAGTLLESSATALNNAMLAQQQQNYAAQMAGGTPSTAPTQMVTPGRMMPQAGAMQTRAAMGQYSPSATPLPAAPQAPMAGSPTAFQYANAADPFTISETMAMLGEPRQGGSEPAAEPQLTNQSTLGQPPAPQPTMSPSEVTAPAPQGMPATSYPVPSSATVPGLGLMSGIQQGIGAIRDVLSGDRQLFGENGMFPADTRNPETRASDWFAAQEEMSRGSDSNPRVDPFNIPTEAEFAAMSASEQQAIRDRLSNTPLFGFAAMGGQTYQDLYPYIFGTTTVADTTEPTPYVPNIPAPYYTPSTLSPYVPATAPTNPVYGYSSYNALQQAMGMAQGGAVRPSMTNAFAPGTYYARYNPYARGLGALRKG